MNFYLLLFFFFFLSSSESSSSSSSSSPLLPNEALPTKSGYLPIHPAPSTSTSSLYYAYYEAQTPPLPQTPLLIWLQGGPGCSSMVGNLFELGPFLISPHHPTLHPNPFSWNRLFGLLFIDNPIGTGFSVAATPEEIPRNQTEVAKHLFVALQSFLSSDPSFKTRPVYVTGESYAGKYVPAFSYYILQQNSRLPKNEQINFGGSVIGNGLTHPVTQVNTHADSAYFTGLINAKQKAHLEELQLEAVKLTNQQKWSEASTARGRALDSLQNLTGLATLYDLRKKKPYQTEMVGVLLNSEEVKEAFGAKKGLLWEECSEIVGGALHADVMKSVKFMVEEVVKTTRVLLYQGLFDLRDGVVSTEAWMKEIEWEGIDMFLNAERKIWKVNGEMAGYVQKWGTLTHVVVSGAGHLVPADQGITSQAMIEDWVLGNGLFCDNDVCCHRL